MALRSEVVDEPEVVGFRGGSWRLWFETVAAAGVEGVCLEIRVRVEASFVVVDFNSLERGEGGLAS